MSIGAVANTNEGEHVSMSPIRGVTKKGVFAGEKPFLFQASAWETFGEDGSFNHQDYSTVGAGEQSTPVGRQLRTCSFETLFTWWEPSWSLIHGPIDPQQAVKDLATIRDAGSPFQLRAWDPMYDLMDIDYPATFRSLHWEKRAGEQDAYYVTVEFKEFSSPTLTEYLAREAAHGDLPVTLDVRHLADDRNTLAKLAKIYYHDPDKWRTIASANGMRNVPPNQVLASKFLSRTKIIVPRLTVSSTRPVGG